MIKRLLLLITLSNASGCLIAGMEAGECSSYEKNELYMPWCQNWVKYTACIPLTRQTPGGTWDNHTLPLKDKWIELQTSRIVMERITHEMNTTLDDLEINELGEEGFMTKRMWNRDTTSPREDVTDCEMSFSQFMCYLNFPRCDTEGRSLILCRSVCENYLNACGYQRDLWRCGDPRFLGAEKPEIPVQDKGTGEYDITWRYAFPGAPFQDNEFEYINGIYTPIIVCTPSILNTAVFIEMCYWLLIVQTIIVWVLLI